jgi:hypothetical protein
VFICFLIDTIIDWTKIATLSTEMKGPKDRGKCRLEKRVHRLPFCEIPERYLSSTAACRLKGVRLLGPFALTSSPFFLLDKNDHAMGRYVSRITMDGTIQDIGSLMSKQLSALVMLQPMMR